ncbi:MAG: amidohydrolase family protein [Oscillospiraceae bacterium]|nr:amidohydrolase family protein [Candidatus Ruminococcus equi]
MKKIVALVLILIMLVPFASGCAKNESADLVVFGNIYTAEKDNNGLAEAFAVKDGKYIYVGTKDEAKKYIEEGKTEVFDKSGEGLIIPGCTEGHAHYFGVYGIGKVLPGQGCSYKELLEVIKDETKGKKTTQFISFGWKTIELSEDRAAGKNFAEEIEAVAPGIPVVLIDNTGHSAVCNTTALKKAGLLENPKVRGGEVALDKDGNPSGFVSDQAVGYICDKAIDDDILTEEQAKQACSIGAELLLKQGYTNALDAYINQFAEREMSDILKKLDESGELKINVASCYNLKSYDAENYKEKVDRVAQIAEECKSKHYNPANIKLFADGVVESATGWMFEEYKNVEKGKEHGNIIWDVEELKKLVSYANSKDILVHTHSFGDAACNAVLDAYIYSNKENGKEYRNCLGHVRNIKSEDVIRAAENKIPIAENLIWHSDVDENVPEQKKQKDMILQHISEDTYNNGYPMKSLIDNGVIMSSSTDAPAAMSIEGNIMNVLEVATTGIMPEDSAKPYAEKELISVREGLEALTINGAWQLGLENERGSVKVGKYADFVILDKNILDYQGEQLRTIHNTQILSTYFEGKPAYTK